jgi:uncharacterized membrane protein YbhN (UPF0104 family)
MRRYVQVAGAVVLTLICLAFVSRRLAGGWADTRKQLIHANPWLLLGGAAAAVLAMVAVAMRWHRAMAVLGVRVGRVDCLRWFAHGQLGKYLPGGVWNVVGQSELARRGGVRGSVSYSSVLLHSIGLYGCAAVGLAASAALPGSVRIAWWAVIVGLALAAVAFEPHLLKRLVQRGQAGEPAPKYRTICRYVAGNSLVWILVAAATVLVGGAIDPSEPIVVVAVAAVASWLVGFVTLPAPGGLGVREIAFVAAVGGSLNSATAAAIALAARMTFVAADGALVPLSHLVGLVERRLARSVELS